MYRAITLEEDLALKQVIATRRQRLNLIPAQHDSIGHPDCNLAQMPTNQWQAQNQNRAAVLPICHCLCHVPALRPGLAEVKG